MAASDFDFLLTRNKLITRAFQKIGALDVYDVLSSEMLSQGVDCLNSMVASWQNDHVFLWRTVEVVIDPWAANLASSPYPGSGDPLVLSLVSAQWWNGVSWETLELIEWDEFTRETDRTAQGVPNRIAHGPVDNKAYLLPVPQAAGKVRAEVITKLKDFDTANGDGGFVARWGDAIIYGLAARLADDYGLPLGERDRLQQSAASLFVAAKRHNRDYADEVFVRPI
jgi:hypothetical protein